MPANYPTTPAQRDAWILSRRTQRHPVDPLRPNAFFLEQERSQSGEVVPVATVFLANRECPWRCLMCDLWKNTLAETVPAGAIPAQIDHALDALARTGAAPRQIKLYNSGSFFDPLAIPPSDYTAIARRVAGFERVIVECHPALVNDRILPFLRLLGTRLEIAMGLETIHPDVLPRLNKRMTPALFARAADFIRRHDIDLRAFVLVKPPFLDEAGALEWAVRSAGFAFDCHATAVTLIPTRPGNGALEALAASGEFAPPRLATLEAAAEHGIRLGRGRVFADLWDLGQFSECAACFPARRERLARMNLMQIVREPVRCPVCSPQPRTREPAGDARK